MLKSKKKALALAVLSLRLKATKMCCLVVILRLKTELVF